MIQLFSRLHPDISIVSFWMLAVEPLAAPNRILDHSVRFVWVCEVTQTLEVWICRFFVRSCFLRVFLFHLWIQIIFFWWLRHGQIFPMRHRSSGRGYIWMVNSLLLLSVHTTCHRRCQAKVVVTAVVWVFPPHHWDGKWHYHSLMIYPASKTYCRWFAHNVQRPLLAWSPILHPKYRW